MLVVFMLRDIQYCLVREGEGEHEHADVAMFFPSFGWFRKEDQI
jgi:hypothetical protein